MTGKVMKRVYLVLLFSFLYVPIAVLIFFSFNEAKSRTVFTRFTLDWYRQLFRNEAVLRALALSLMLALVSAVIATLIGTLAAMGMNQMRKRGRTLVMNMSYIPVINPEIITGVSMMLLFVVMKNGMASMAGPEGEGVWGWISRNFLGVPSLLIAHITFNLPYVLFTVSPKLRQADKSLYDAALDLGCTEWQAFYKVVLPEIMPAIFSSFLICLTYSIDDFTISYFTAGNRETLPIAVYSMTRKKVSPEINALSTIMFVVIFTIIIAANYREGMKERRNKRKSKAART